MPLATVNIGQRGFYLLEHFAKIVIDNRVAEKYVFIIFDDLHFVTGSIDEGGWKYPNVHRPFPELRRNNR